MLLYLVSVMSDYRHKHTIYIHDVNPTQTLSENPYEPFDLWSDQSDMEEEYRPPKLILCYCLDILIIQF